MPLFNPGEIKTARVTMRNPTTKDLSGSGKLWLGLPEVIKSEKTFFIPAKGEILTDFPVTMPAVAGIYPVFLSVSSEGKEPETFQATEDVTIPLFTAPSGEQLVSVSVITPTGTSPLSLNPPYPKAAPGDKVTYVVTAKLNKEDIVYTVLIMGLEYFSGGRYLGFYITSLPGFEAYQGNETLGWVALDHTGEYELKRTETVPTYSWLGLPVKGIKTIVITFNKWRSLPQGEEEPPTWENIFSARLPGCIEVV